MQSEILALYKLSSRLKDFGYDGICDFYWIDLPTEKSRHPRHELRNWDLKHIPCQNSVLPPEQYTAPRIDDINKWLRDHKNLFVEISILGKKKFTFQCFEISSGNIMGCRDASDFSSYEAALHRGLEEGINLLTKSTKYARIPSNS